MLIKIDKHIQMILLNVYKYLKIVITFTKSFHQSIQHKANTTVR